MSSSLPDLSKEKKKFLDFLDKNEYDSAFTILEVKKTFTFV